VLCCLQEIESLKKQRDAVDRKAGEQEAKAGKEWRDKLAAAEVLLWKLWSAQQIGVNDWMNGGIVFQREKMREGKQLRDQIEALKAVILAVCLWCVSLWLSMWLWFFESRS
jgi:hypothetical protein